MGVPRQGKVLETGRVNQKARTRAALVEAAEELLRQGVTPTVAQAAEAAQVGRTTAYRYFPTQESLLVELSLTVDVSALEALVAEPVDRDGARQRVLDVVQALNRHVQQEQVQYRTAIRLYQDQWLEAFARGDTSPTVREGRRTRWLAESLAPLELPEEERERLVAAISLVIGAESVVVLADVCHLSGDDALAVTEWAARALLDAALGPER
jgi:AcrR family transcriptional regulator